MAYRVRDQNGINQYAEKPIGKFGRIYPKSQRVTAEQVPTRFRRAEIQARAQAQAPEDKFHFGLVRVD